MMHALMIMVFCLGYLAIALEHGIKINKAATALLTAVICWTLLVLNSPNTEIISHHLPESLSEISSILFFLLGAMTLVELIDAHDGFQVITSKINTKNARHLLWMVAVFTFFLSAIIDNLTTAIVMVTLLRKLVTNREQRLYFVAIVVITANAGGAWSPLGDVTTTMLWIGGQISAIAIIKSCFLPSLISALIPVFIVSKKIDTTLEDSTVVEANLKTSLQSRYLVLFLGLGIFLFVPIFKTMTHLPPYMGMLLGLGIMWVCTELIHRRLEDEDRDQLSVANALQKIDTPSILFFLGILLSVSSLQTSGLLRELALALQNLLPNENVLISTVGLFSAIVDNVPLVAAMQKMYSLEQYHLDASFWHFLAYATGTGGSILIIGSAAGVAAMGLEKITFGWYFKKVSWLVLIGYSIGIAAFLLLN